MEKICKITNGKFTWILEVDGHIIGFEGTWNAEYFAKHYRGLGYNVIAENWTFKEDNLQTGE